MDLIQGLRTPAGDRIMCFVTSLGNGGMIWILLAVVLLLIPRTRRSGAVLLTALIFDVILCNGILKNAFARVRPCDVNTAVQLLIPRPDDYSFPSGHTAASFAAAAALFFAGERKLWKPALVLAVLIAFSRLYLYVHYPTDILGGILLGIACGYMGMRGTDQILIKRKKADHIKEIKKEIRKEIKKIREIHEIQKTHKIHKSFAKGDD